MSENENKNITRLDESFGQLTSQTSSNPEAAVTDSTEDDKTEKLADNLHLSYEQPSTNDAPEQAVSDTPTAAQNKISKAIMKTEKKFRKSTDFVKDEAEARQEAVDAQLDAIFGPAKSRFESLKETASQDPAKTIEDILKCLALITAIVLILHAIFHRH